MPVADLAALRARAQALGFDAFGVCAADAAPRAAQRLTDWLAQGCHGDMIWMETTQERRASPAALWADVRSIIMLGMSYAPAVDPLAHAHSPDVGVLSVYARNRDYHDLLKGRLKQLAGWLVSRHAGAVKVFVDTAPVMEKPLAQAAGLGWQGKHTNLVSRTQGSWLFLGAIYTSLELSSAVAHADHCGSCHACLDACPTQAFPAPYRLDARRCISYLTIEHKGPIPLAFRAAIGNRIYGCDDCLAVCPWNRFARQAREIGLQAREDLNAPSLVELAGLDDTAFRQLFSGSPVKRIGRNRFLRNVLTALGNAADPAHEAVIKPHLADPDPVVRGAAVWALRMCLPDGMFDRLRLAHLSDETEDQVRAEWDAG